MFYFKINNLLAVSLILFLAAFVYAGENTEYISIGVRDPMVKPITVIKPTTIKNKSEKAKIDKQTKQRELQKIISQSKIEGVVFGADNKPLLMINDKIISEGSRISKKSDVYVVKIELKKIVFSLNNETVTYVLSSLKKDTEP